MMIAELLPHFGIVVESSSGSMRGPAFQKNFTTRDPILRMHFYGRLRCLHESPRRRTERTKGVVLRGDSLKIEQQRLFHFPRRLIARAWFGVCGRLHLLEHGSHSLAAEDEVIDEVSAARLKESVARPAHFAVESGM